MDSANKYYKSIDGNLYSKDGTELIQYAAGKTDISFTVPDGVKTIHSYAFYGCTADIVWGNNPVITEIESYAFAGYAGSSITIPNSVTSIAGGAFYNCSNLVSITLPFVGGSAAATEASASTLFGYIFGITKYTGGTSTDQSYASNKHTTYYIPSTLTTVTLTGGKILYGAFYNCEKLTSITIPDSITNIGAFAFINCTALTSIYYSGTASQWACISFGDGYANPLLYADNLYLDGTLVTDITLDNLTTINAFAFYGYTSFISIIIPNSVTSIGSYAFYGCTSLISITIPDSVTSIGDFAFFNCKSLTSITIGNSVTSIGNKAFSNCYKLVEVYNLSSLTITAGSNDYGYVGYYAKNIYTSESGSSYLTTQDGYIFYNDDSNYYLVGYTGSDTALTLPTLTVYAETVSYAIYDYAFYYNTKITSITIPDSVISINYKAFEGCTSLTSIIIPDSITSIGNNAFYGCYKLVEVYNLSSLTITAGSTGNGYVGYYAKNVYTSKSGSSYLTTLDDYLFYNDNGTYYLISYTGNDMELTLPTTVNSEAVSYYIYRYAFYENTKITNVSIPDGVSFIGDYTFSNCTSLKSVTIPDSVTSISSYAFYGCNALTSVYYNGTASQWASISFSDSYANSLYYAGNLYLNGTLATDITLEGITTINDYAFSGCTSLTSITIPDSVTSIGNKAFYNCNSFESVYYSGSVSQWASITFNDYYSNPLYYAGNLYLNGELVTNITLEGITTINAYAFNGSTSLTSITIPDSVTSIDGYAFYGCIALTSITIGNGVTSIGSSAFSGCTSLTSLTIPNSVTSIGNAAFMGCTSLTSITIPNSVTSIGNVAFYNCTSLKSVTIGNSVTSIGFNAFYGCSSLTSVTFKDTTTWYYTSISGATSGGTLILSSSLSNTSTAATYLTSTYSGEYYWYKK